MAEIEVASNLPFPDFLLRMGPIFNRADVRAAQVSLLFISLPPDYGWLKGAAGGE